MIRISIAIGICMLVRLAVDVTPASAAIINSTGAVTVIASPLDVNNGVKESDTQVFAFPEQQNVTLATGIDVDVSLPGSTPASGIDDDFSPATLAAGTRISSYFLHCDAVGSPSPPVTFTGSVTFDGDVLGLIILNNSLNATASLPGLPGTAYSGNGGLEINSTAAFDSITLSADRRTVSFDFRDANSPDDVRIFTTAAPEPSAGLLLAIGGGALALWRRRNAGGRRDSAQRAFAGRSAKGKRG